MISTAEQEILDKLVEHLHPHGDWVFLANVFPDLKHHRVIARLAWLGHLRHYQISYRGDAVKIDPNPTIH